MRIKRLLELLGLTLAKPYEKMAIELLKIHAAVNYLRLIRLWRTSYVRLLELLLCFVVLTSGFVMLHGALLFSLIPSLLSRALWVALLGLSEIIAAALYLSWFFSAKRWVHEATKFSPWVTDILRKNKKEPWL